MSKRKSARERRNRAAASARARVLLGTPLQAVDAPADVPQSGNGAAAVDGRGRPEAPARVVRIRRRPQPPDLRSRAQAALLALVADLEPLWVTGLVLLCLLGATWLLLSPLVGVSDLRYPWLVYVVMGTVFPVLLIGLVLVPYWLGMARLVSRYARLAAALLAVVVLIVFAAGHGSFALLLLSLAQLALSWLLLSRGAGPRSLPRAVAALLVIYGAWMGAVRFMWWANFDDSIRASLYAFAMFALTLVVVMVNVHRARVPIPRAYRATIARGRAAVDALRDRRLNAGLTVLGILVIAAASVRTTYLFEPASIYNWGVWVGPAELMRQGSQPLWDDPTPYGFLSNVVVALFPAGDVWQSFYTLQALAFFLSATIIFLVLRSIRPGLTNLAFSLCVAMAAVYLLPGFPPGLTGTQWQPNVGSYRFFWCYILLAVLFWIARGKSSDPRDLQKKMIAGSVVWLLGTFWAFESAIYSAAIWFPTLALLIAQWRSLRPGPRWRGIQWVLLPPALVVAVVVLVSLSYLLAFGHAPDWKGIWEWAVTFGGGLDELPLDRSGAVWTLVLLFCALATAASYALLRRRYSVSSRIALVGSWATVAIICSYFVKRSAPINMNNISSVLFCAVAVALFALWKSRRVSWWDTLTRMSLVPAIVVPLALVLGNSTYLPDYLGTLGQGYDTHVAHLLPVIDGNLQELFDFAHVTPNDPMVLYDPTPGGVVPPYSDLLPAVPFRTPQGTRLQVMARGWLPAEPMAALLATSDARKQLYMLRFAQRTHLNGWLIERTAHPIAEVPWFASFLQQWYVPVKRYQSDTWQITWYRFEPNGAPQTGQPPVPTKHLSIKTTSKDVVFDIGNASQWLEPNLQPVSEPPGSPPAWLVTNNPEIQYGAPLNLCLSNYDYAYVRIAASPNIQRRTMRLYLLLDNAPLFTDDKSIIVTLNPDGGMHSYLLDLRSIPQSPTTRLRGVRLDPVDWGAPPGPNRVQIAAFHLIPSSSPVSCPGQILPAK